MQCSDSAISTKAVRYSHSREDWKWTLSGCISKLPINYTGQREGGGGVLWSVCRNSYIAEKPPSSHTSPPSEVILIKSNGRLLPENKLFVRSSIIIIHAHTKCRHPFQRPWYAITKYIIDMLPKCLGFSQINWLFPVIRLQDVIYKIIKPMSWHLFLERSQVIFQWSKTFLKLQISLEIVFIILIYCNLIIWNTK